MKNFISILFVFLVLFCFCQSTVVFSQNKTFSDQSGVSIFKVSGDQMQISVTGTGHTTGHIGDVHLQNLTDEDILINFPPAFIPSNGRNQPYILPPQGSVTVPGGSASTPAPEIIFPLNGYCVDVTLPPVPLGETMPPLDKWIEPRMNNFDQDGFNPSIPPVPLDDFFDGEFIIPPIRPWSAGDDFFDESGRETIEIALPPTIILPVNPLPRDLQDDIFDFPVPAPIFEPDLDPPLVTGFPEDQPDFFLDPIFSFDREVPVVQLDPRKDTELFVDLIFDAIIKISETVDELIDDGNLITPLSDREDFRETTIQQTFWIYTSVLIGTPYVFDDFRENLIDQFTEATSIDLDEAPESMKEEFEAGAVSIWESFKFVGEQAKVIKEVVPHKDQIEESFGASLDDVKPHLGSGAEEDTESLGAEAPALGDDVAFGETPNLFDATHEASHVVETAEGNLESTETPSDVFEPADPPCVCDEVNVVSEGVAYGMDDIGQHANRSLIEGNTVTSLTPYIEFQPPEVTVNCPDHCPSSIEYSHQMTRNQPFKSPSGRGWRSGPISVGTDGEPKTFIFETTVTASCGGVPCPPMEMRREIEVVETNDCCTEIRNRNNGRLVFDAGDRSVLISGNSLIVHPNNRWEKSRSFNFPYNIEAVFCNLGSDQVFGLTESEMESSSAGERYRRSNLTMSELPERNNEMVEMEIHGPYAEEIRRQMPRTFPASYVISFQQQQNGDEFSFAMSMDKETCRTMIQVFQNGRLIESIDGVVQN
ncbi:MAG: DUF4157 domain-containing protein [Saprospirales bacterium]|nr:MAG: DUF4157 domain-containing protein [Saprospirales bacterium]